MMRARRRYKVARPTVGVSEVVRVASVVASGWMTQGRMVERFEAAFADLMGVPAEHVVACSSGTSALSVALMATVPRGSHVVLPSLTYAGTLNAVLAAGLHPWFCDVSESSWCTSVATIDAALAEYARIAPCDQTLHAKIGGIVPVHLYGHLATPTQEHGSHALPIIEDACEALGAHDLFGEAGKRGVAGVFSFFANKQLTTLGEGGVVVARTTHYAREMRCVRGQGQGEGQRYVHRVAGLNARMTEAQAAFGLAQLARFEREDARRRILLHDYRRAFHTLAGAPQMVKMRSLSPLLYRDHGGPRNHRHHEGAWLFAARCRWDVRAVGLVERLAAVGVEARPMFAPLHSFPFVRSLPGQSWQAATEFPHTERIARSAFALPLHAGLRGGDVEEIAGRVVTVLHDIERERGTHPEVYVPFDAPKHDDWSMSSIVPVKAEA